MTAFTALLSIKEVSKRTLCVYVTLLQSAGPSGAIDDKVDVLVRHYNKLFENTRITQEKLKNDIDTLFEKGIIPSRGAVYPFASNSVGHSKNIDEIIEVLEEDMSDVRPDPTRFPDESRIFSALKMANALEIAAKTEKVRMTHDDHALVVNGELKKRQRRVWDYGLVGKMKGKYGADEVIDAICEIHLDSGFDEFDKFGFEKRRRHKRKWLFGYLEGNHGSSKESTSETEMIY